MSSHDTAEGAKRSWPARLLAESATLSVLGSGIADRCHIVVDDE